MGPRIWWCRMNLPYRKAAHERTDEHPQYAGPALWCPDEGARGAGADHHDPRHDDPAAAAFVLDLLFTFNIALSIMVLLVGMYTQRPLDFAAFPAVLLFSTLLRLSLNVASTRVVLLEGHTGPTPPAR
jgi:hypothetical protein